MKQIATAILLFYYIIAQSQDKGIAKNAFINQDLQLAFDFWNISKSNTKFHSSFKPYLSSSYSEASDSMVPFKFYSFNNSYLLKSVGEQKSNNLQVLPILDLECGYERLKSRSLFSTLGGFHLKLNKKNNISLALTIVGGNRQFPSFLDGAIANQKIIPEFGQAYSNSKNGYSFFDYTGYISYTPKNTQVFNFQLGRDKHFIGDGYRSVLLSDYAAAYPYFRINTNLWRFQYNVWYTWMYDVSQAKGIKNNYTNKFGAFHYLSYNIIKELNIGLFENIIWRGSDTNQVRTFEVNYLNPIIFFRPQEFAVGSPDNSFIGLNLNATLFKKIKIYAQLGLDEFYLKEIKANRGWWGNKQAWQIGTKYINALGIRGLKIQAEYNEVKPYTYTHGLVSQNYAHYGMPLAHPLGANFKEFIGIVNYRKNKWELRWQGQYVILGKDSSANSNVGQNIFLSYVTRNSEYGNFTTQGLKSIVIQNQFQISYLMAPKLNMRFELGLIHRSEKNTSGYKLQSPFLFIAFRTSFWNSYRDF